MSSNQLDHEPDHVQYVDEQEMRVVVGPSRSDNWNFQRKRLRASYLAERLRSRGILTSLRIF